MSSSEEEAFDLSSVLTSNVLTFGFNYILIIEWLFNDDERTGFSLYEWLSGNLPAGKVEYAQCRSPSELEARLEQARRDISVCGVPIVHFEAHGEDPALGQVPRGLVGPDGIGVGELLSWQRLGDILRPLNIASGFNLLVIGAACYGEGLMLGAPGGKPMPFVAVVGYTEKNIAVIAEALIARAISQIIARQVGARAGSRSCRSRAPLCR